MIQFLPPSIKHKSRRYIPVVGKGLSLLMLLGWAFRADAQSDSAPGKTPPGLSLGTRARGEAAIRALSEHLPEVARYYGEAPERLRELLSTDSDLWVDPTGRLLYVCEYPADAPSVDGSAVVESAAMAPLDQTFRLHSRPGALRKIYLDFNGHTTTGTLWNQNYNGGASFVTPAFDIDGNPGSFSSTELERIQYIWQRVVEDYAPFEVDVTTEDPGVEGLRKTTSTDLAYGTRVVIGGSSYDWFGSSAGGVAYIGCFDWSSDTPCFVWPTQLGTGNEKYVAEAISHEAGHTVALYHDGKTDGTAYYAGHGDWASIMGVGYYKSIVQWSKGEYSLANNTQDDLAVIQSYVPYRPDDHGNWIGAATILSGPTLQAQGVIERNTDVDVFGFVTGAGVISLSVATDPRSSDLDALVSLYDAAGNLVTSANPASLGATLNLSLPAGTYYLAIDGVGTGSPTTGYSDYASLGQYSVTGTIISTGAQQSPIAVASASPINGTAPLAVNFSSAGSYDPDGYLVSYDWEFGDGGISTLANPQHSYAAAGSYTASLVVRDNAGFSDFVSLTITVQQPANVLPIVSVTATPTNGVAPLNVAFSSAGSYDPDGSIAAYSWNFGDGTTSTAANPSHIYASQGTYTATLTVTDNRGGKASKSRQITVQPVQQPANVLPIAAVTATPTNGVAPLTVTFSSAGSYDPDGSIASYSWNFGDGTTSTAANPSHLYASQGTYTATLTVTDNRGGKASKSRSITVQPDLSKIVIVKSIAMSLVPAPSGTIAKAQVTIVRKSNGAPITSATVTGTWSGIVSGSASGISGTDGKCTVSSPKTKHRGTYTFTVTNVSASGLTYQPAQNVITGNSITN